LALKNSHVIAWMDRLTSDFTNCYGPIWKSCLEALSNSDLKSSEYATPVLGLISGKLSLECLDPDSPPSTEYDASGSVDEAAA